MKQDKERFDRYEQVARELLSDKRFYHTQCVVKQARALARRYDCDVDKAVTAAWLHDICKELPRTEQLQWIEKSGIMLDSVQLTQPKTWHGMAAAGYLRVKLGINDPELEDAVRYHTTARGCMTRLDEVVYLADLTSEERDYPDAAQMRALALRSLKPAMREAMRFAVSELCRDGLGISLDTFEAYNCYIRCEDR